MSPPRGARETHTGHRRRMYARFACYGFDGLHPHEILEIILYDAIPRRNTNPLAHRLLDEFGSLAGVLGADEAELMRVPGVGRKTAQALASILPDVSEQMIRQLREAGALGEDGLRLLAHFETQIRGTAAGIAFCEEGGVLRSFVGMKTFTTDENRRALRHTPKKAVSAVLVLREDVSADRETVMDARTRLLRRVSEVRILTVSPTGVLRQIEL